LIKAAKSDAPKVNRNAARTRGELTDAINSRLSIIAALRNRAEIGINTINDRYRMVYPIVRPKPGSFGE
jgi:hypothetical protein